MTDPLAYFRAYLTGTPSVRFYEDGGARRSIVDVDTGEIIGDVQVQPLSDRVLVSLFAVPMRFGGGPLHVRQMFPDIDVACSFLTDRLAWHPKAAPVLSRALGAEALS